MRKESLRVLVEMGFVIAVVLLVGVAFSGVTRAPPKNTPIVASSTGILLQQIPATCTRLSAMAVGITVPTGGNVVVGLTADVSIDHTVGTLDALALFIRPSSSSATCGLGFGDYEERIPASWPTTFINRKTIFFQTIFPVGAGTHSFVVDAVMGSGPSLGDNFLSGLMIAVFYPS